MSIDACYHCGDEIIGSGYQADGKEFCCNGCKSVYLLLKENKLDSFYTIDSKPGVKPSESNRYKYAFLEVVDIRRKFITFEDDKSVHTTLFLPEIHCSSCIYLLENLTKIDPRIQSCQVNFAKREASMIFSNDLKLSELADLLDKIGYAPNFGEQKKQNSVQNKRYLYKLGVAGFAFGSIMLWSFPEYLGIEGDSPDIRRFTSYLSFAVSIPVILYSAREYFVSAFKALKFKSINLDVPISIGIFALYLQSCYTIFSGQGPGYMDSFAGFVFFLLIGKWFQNKTYQSLSFERDYTAYFPVAITRLNEGRESIVEINKISIGDTILVRNQEVIPCDAVLDSDEIKIDYSFVTGESDPIIKRKGDFIYAGGKLIGQQSRLIVQNESDRSHLTQLWNKTNSSEKETANESDRLSVYFLLGLMVTAIVTAIIWSFVDTNRIVEIVVSVLIVACPCALALSGPFTYGNIMRVLGRKGLYLKNASVIKKINSCDTIVFDKTGTLTTGNSQHVEYDGKPLNDVERNAILVVANSSTHPLSRAIVQYLRKQTGEISKKPVSDFVELSGKGITGKLDDLLVKIGSAEYIGTKAELDRNETTSYVSINDIYLGKFTFKSEFREGMVALLNELKSVSAIHVLSGDSNKDKVFFDTHLPFITTVRFNQTPQAKYDYINSLQMDGKRVMMIGDGLNDAGALEVATTGIAISEDVFRFTPSSDAIIEASKLNKLNDLIRISRFSKNILIACYVFSIIYNIIGLSFAISGNLSPLIAAILMPLSSISIVVLSTTLSLLKN